MPTIRLENLVKRYGQTEVLHGIDLEMAENEFTVLVGPSGCGKSTTLRMIAGLDEITSGEIYVDGNPIGHMEPKDRDLAMVFQDYALYPHMNVAQNISFALRLARRPRRKINAKVREVAAMVGLSDLLHRKPGALSGGQRQRVAMARALAKDSAIFLFDEPLSNLDAKLRGQMRAELALMRRQVRKNMIYVTHDQVEAMTLADRIVVMRGGRIQQQGAPEDLFERPANRFVAGFLGMPPMSFLDCRIEISDEETRVRGEGFDLLLEGERAQAAARHACKGAILGLRPTDLSHSPDAPPERALHLEVEVAEYVGAQTVLLCKCGTERVTAEVSSGIPMTPGEKLTFAVDPKRIHLFDRDSEVAL